MSISNLLFSTYTLRIFSSLHSEDGFRKQALWCWCKYFPPTWLEVCEMVGSMPDGWKYAMRWMDVCTMVASMPRMLAILGNHDPMWFHTITL